MSGKVSSIPLYLSALLNVFASSYLSETNFQVPLQCYDLIFMMVFIRFIVVLFRVYRGNVQFVI